MLCVVIKARSEFGAGHEKHLVPSAKPSCARSILPIVLCLSINLSSSNHQIIPPPTHITVLSLWTEQPQYFGEYN